MKTVEVSVRRAWRIAERAAFRYAGKGNSSNPPIRNGVVFQDKVLRRWAKWTLGSEVFTIEVLRDEGRILFYR